MFTLKKYLIDHHVLKIKIPKERLWLRIIGMGIVGTSLGFIHGYNSSDDEDKTKYCVKFSGQEEQFFQLLDETNKPILKFYYTSGQPYLFKQRPDFLKAAKLYHNDVHFMMINCSQHYQHCRNIDFQSMPFVSAVFPSSSKIEAHLDGIYPVVNSDKDFSLEGVESFLKNLQIIKKDKVANILKN